MADKEIPELTAATTPLAGTETVHIVQGGNSREATLSDIAALSTGAMLASTYDPDTNGIIAVAQGGTNAATAAGARTNLGLGTMAVQGAGAVAITGGTVVGITDLTVADGGTGASDASGARTNLGLAIGTDVQAYSANLAGFAATTVANVQNRDNHTGTQLAATISDFSTAADLRIAAAVGVSVQAYDPLLASVSGLSLTAGDIIYATGSDAVASLPVGAAGQVLAVNGAGEPAWDTSLVVGGLIAANNLSDVANSDTSLTNLGFGAAGKAIAADATTEDVRSYLNLAKPSATRTAMKALDWTQYDRFELFESGREGVFLKNTSDLSSILVGSAVNSSAVDSGTDTITSTAHGLGTGNAVITTTAVNGLALNTIYYVILVDANNFQLATSYANAVAGTEIDLTGTTAVTVKLHFDPNETLYVTPTTDITGASGAAIRQHEGVLMSSWAGVPDDSTSDCSPSIAALIALCNRNAIWGTIQFRNAGYRLGTRLPDITRNVVIRGTRAAFQRSILIKDYVETSDNKGILTFVNGGWVLEDLTLAGLSGASGGCGIAQVTTGTTAATANTASHFMNRVHIALGDRVKKTFFLNGGTNVEVAGPGLRVVMINSCEFFGAAEWTLDFQSTQHVFISNSFVSTSGGTASGGALRIGGTASAPSDDYSIDTTLIAGLIDLDRLSRSKFDGLRVQGNINNTSNCTHIRILGTYNSGTLQHNWDNDNCEYSLGVQYKDVAHVSRASSQQADITGDGTKAVILWDTVASMASLLNWDSTLVYNTANGRFTALKTGVHSIRANPMLVGLTSSHTQCDVFVETFTSGGSAVLVRQNRFNPWAIATGTRASIPIAEDLMMGVGQYMTISVTVTGGTKVVDIDHVSGFSRAQFKLAS